MKTIYHSEMEIKCVWDKDGTTTHTVGLGTTVEGIGYATCTRITLTFVSGIPWVNAYYESEDYRKRIISFIFTENMRISYDNGR